MTRFYKWLGVLGLAASISLFTIGCSWDVEPEDEPYEEQEDDNIEVPEEDETEIE